MHNISLILFIICCVITIPLLWWIHCLLELWYVWLGRRFCIKHSLTPSQWKLKPAFTDSGIKTEYTFVELFCIHPENGKFRVRLLVWIFGVHAILSIEPFFECEKDL